MIQLHFTDNYIDEFCAAYQLEQVQIQSFLEFIQGPASLNRFNLINKTLKAISENVLELGCTLGVSNEVLNTLDQLKRLIH